MGSKDKEQAVLRLLGLATRAGKTFTGYENCRKAIKSGKAAIVLIARDTSEETMRPMMTLCGYHGVRCFVIADKEQLSIFTGKQNRAVAAVVDQHFASALTELINGIESLK